MVLFYHFAVVAGVALTAAGSSNLMHPSEEHPYEKSLRILKAGIAILTICWVALSAWAGASFVTTRSRAGNNNNTGASRAGSLVSLGFTPSSHPLHLADPECKQLLMSVCFSLIFVGIRVIYSLVAMCSQEAYLSPTTGAMPIRVLLSFLPEIIVTLTYLLAGFKTMGMAKESAVEKTPSSE